VRPGQPPLRASLAAPAEERTGFLSIWLLLLIPFALLGLLLVSGLALYFLFGTSESPPSAAVKVEVQQQSAKKATTTRSGPPKYNVKVEDQPPEFIRTTPTEPAVQVDITDESEERPPPKEQPVKVEITGEDTSFTPSQPAGESAVDKKPRVFWQYGTGMRFGITAVETKKLLTYAPNGETNQTMVRVNNSVFEFGGNAGKFLERDVKLPASATGKTFGGSKSTWAAGKLVFTQILELVPSKQPVLLGGQSKRLLDTVQVRYIIENRDTKALSVGLRLQLDTLIGNNDGVPFTVPGLPGLVTNVADFPRDGPIPDFIQALERPNLQDPGTVAHVSLKLGKGIEPPGRVSLTHWPGGGYPSWEVPLTSLAGDSAVIFYWNEQMLKPGEKRTVGFAYGLGSVASTEPGGKLGLTLGGNFGPGEVFTTTAYVQNPVKGQKLTLELPAGLERAEGEETQMVAPPTQGSNNTSVVTWKVKVMQTGTFPLKVVSSTGQAQARTITIARGEAEPEAKLTVHLAGAYEPGKEFTVEAKLVSGPQPPALALKLPSALMQLGDPTSEATPSADKKETVTVTRWKVKVLETGKHAVRVEAANGLAVTKTLSIVRSAVPTGGDVSVALEPPFAPGKVFTLKATVKEPLPGQTLTFTLPPGLSFVEGEEKMPVAAGKEPTTLVTWKVKVGKAGTFPLRVESSNGIVLKKTISIEQREEKKETGGTFELTYAGDIEPGKEFKLLAKVSQPVPGQKLTLTLPREIQLVEGAAARSVPAATGNTSLVSWRVRVLDKGTLSIRVESSTGMVRTMTITLTAAPTSGGGGGGGQLFGGK
jgi:hypothetical protein